jgi:23S rRNA (adenine2030-N6)-methyltransferase
MNYRHLYHAGNFADVMKHITLVRVLHYLQRKDAAIRVIDSHAGIGLYDLNSEAAQKTREYQHGIDRLVQPLPEQAQSLIAPYLALIKAVQERHGASFYPGSPVLIREMKRDAWSTLSGLVPPPEKRGLVLIDPPYEQEDDMIRMAHMLTTLHAKWQTGVLIGWYPIKNMQDAKIGTAYLKAHSPSSVLNLEILIRRPVEGVGLNGSGLWIVNPPWTLAHDMKILLPALAAHLAQGAGAFAHIEAWNM